MGTDMRKRNMGGMIPKEENYLSDTSSTTNPMWAALVMNLGLCCGRPVANCDMTLHSLNKNFCAYNVWRMKEKADTTVPTGRVYTSILLSW
jgi:hypothetical protein